MSRAFFRLLLHRPRGVCLALLLAGELMAACQPAYPVGPPPDRSCVPDWPEECLGAQDTPGGTTGADGGEEFVCDPPPELGDGERSAYSCIQKPAAGDCPPPDSPCAADALDVQWIADCRACLRETVEIACGPDPAVDDACCYRLVVTSPAADDCD